MTRAATHPAGGSAAPAPPDDASLGEWLHRELLECCGSDDDPWAAALVGEVETRLNAARAPAPPLTTVVLYSGAVAAFVGPGRYVYVTRGLLHRAWRPEAVAFAVAHEMAHVDLGHTRVLHEKLEWVWRLPGTFLLAAYGAMAARWVHGPEREAEADARALELCLEAGFDGTRSIEMLDLLASHATDLGDLEIVFGPDAGPGERGPGQRLREWLWRHARGYPSLTIRREALAARLRGERPCLP